MTRGVSFEKFGLYLQRYVWGGGGGGVDAPVAERATVEGLIKMNAVFY